jgi:site-specific recombinase XerD
MKSIYKNHNIAQKGLKTLINFFAYRIWTKRIKVNTSWDEGYQAPYPMAGNFLRYFKKTVYFYRQKHYINSMNKWQGQSQDIKYLNGEQLKAFLKAIQKNKRDSLLFNLIYRFGLRLQEAVNLTLEDLDLENRRIRIFRVKRRDRGRVSYYPLDENLVEMARKYLRARKKFQGKSSRFLFLSSWSKGKEGRISRPQVQKRFSDYGKEIGLPEKINHVHALRHTCGIMLSKSGMNAEQIREWLGHVSLLSTQVYIQLGGREREELNLKCLEALKR